MMMSMVRMSLENREDGEQKIFEEVVVGWIVL